MINEIVKKIGTDKLLHVLICFALAVIACDVSHFFTCDKWLVGGIGYLAFFIFGMAKELFDEKKSGEGDEHDWKADIIGGTIGVIVAMTMMI